MRGRAGRGGPFTGGHDSLQTGANPVRRPCVHPRTSTVGFPDIAAFAPVDWLDLFAPKAPLLELLVRGTLTYLALFVLLRVTPQRQASGLSISDLLVVVLIADAASPALQGKDAESLADGVVLVAVVLFWNWLINWLSYRVGWLERFQYPRPIPLIRDGRPDRRAMRKEMVTEEELLTQLRREGLERFDQVKLAQLEGDGTVSVVPAEGEATGGGGGQGAAGR